MPYTINFSDPTKQTTVSVPDMPPGINTVDTSLSLVGRGYPNYGQKMAENFVHLLENFASPLPPENPIEGQLWFDTSDANHKVLRIMDGTASAVRWPSANGIYQQSTDPNNQYTVKNGDVWVDTSENNLKLWDGLTWQIVGPNSNTSNSLLTGSVVENVKAIDGSTYPVIKNYVNGDVISIVSGLTTASFTPASVIQGFLQIKPGVTFSNQVVNNSYAQLYGTAQSAYNLKLDTVSYSASEFLRKSDTTVAGQEITGKVVFRTTSTTGPLGRDGIIILPQGQADTYIQLYKSNNDGVLLNNTIGGKLIFQTNPTGSITDLYTGMAIDPVTGVKISTSTEIIGLTTLDGGLISVAPASFAGTITVAGPIIAGSTISVDDDVQIRGQLYLDWNSGQAGSAIIPGTPTTARDNTYDIGSSSAYFRRIYAKQIGTSGITQFFGTLTGSATRLDKPIQVAIKGQVTASIFTVQGDGVGSSVVTSLTPTAISGQTTLTTSTASTSMLVLNNGALSQTTKRQFLADVCVPGMIMLWASATATPPTGWLICDGSSKGITAYPDLFAAISWTFGNSGAVFALPSLPAPIPNAYYIIKY